MKNKKCTKCENAFHPIQLWDGREYCSDCIRTLSEELFSYAKDNQTLASSVLVSRLFDANKSKKSANRIAFYTALAFAAYFLLCAFSVFDASLIFDSLFLAFVVFVFVRFYCYFHKKVHFTSFFSYYPKISVKDGIVTIVFYDRSHFYPPQSFVFPLQHVSLKKACVDETNSAFLYPLYLLKSEVLLLDFTKLYSENRLKPNVKILTFINETLSHNPKIICCNDPAKFPVWESFFSVISFGTKVSDLVPTMEKN